MSGLNKNGMPITEGVYLVKETGYCSGEETIDVYDHPIKGLSCFSEDFGSAGTGIDDECDCHVSIQNTGMEFIKRVRDLG